MAAGMEFVAATNNQHKLAEIRRILGAMGHRVVSLGELGLDIDPEETGATFAQNASIKAIEVCKAAGLPAVADDSGLVVDALAGAPGVYTARFVDLGGPPEDWEFAYPSLSNHEAANIAKLLRLMQGVPRDKRTARFVSAVALAMPGRESLPLVAEGYCEGLIGEEPSGEHGFGYDPVFYVNGKSFAQMDDAEKDAISHRANALKAFAERLPGFLEDME